MLVVQRCKSNANKRLICLSMRDITVKVEYAITMIIVSTILAALPFMLPRKNINRIASSEIGSNQSRATFCLSDTVVSMLAFNWTVKMGKADGFDSHVHIHRHFLKKICIKFFTTSSDMTYEPANTVVLMSLNTTRCLLSLMALKEQPY